MDGPTREGVVARTTGLPHPAPSAYAGLLGREILVPVRDQTGRKEERYGDRDRPVVLRVPRKAPVGLEAI